MPDDHIYFTFVDIGFGLVLGISIEYMVNIIEETPDILSKYGISKLHITSIFILTALTFLIIAVKWVIYRETIVSLYKQIELGDIVKNFIDKNLEFLYIYLIIESMLSFSPMVYLTSLKLKTISHINLPKFLHGICPIVLFISPNYLADIYVTYPTLGFYGRLIESIKYNSSTEKSRIISKLSSISNIRVTAVNATILFAILMIGISQVTLGLPREPWDIGIVLLFLLFDALVGLRAALRITRKS